MNCSVANKYVIQKFKYSKVLIPMRKINHVRSISQIDIWGILDNNKMITYSHVKNRLYYVRMVAKLDTYFFQVETLL